MTENTENVDNGEVEESTEDLTNMFMGSGGQFFRLTDEPLPLFEEEGSTEEMHDPSDTLDTYSEAFQVTVKQLRAIRSWDRMKQAGKAIFAARGELTKREFNWLMTEYRLLKEKRRPQITDTGKVAITEFKTYLSANSDNLKMVGQRLYKMRSELEEKGLNETEIDALWQLYNKAKGGESNTEMVSVLKF